MKRTAWLVWATQGEYSARLECPLVVCDSEADAQQLVAKMQRLWRDLIAIYKSREDELEDAGDFSGETLWATTEQGRELLTLFHQPQDLSSFYAEDREYTCCPVPVANPIDGGGV